MTASALALAVEKKFDPRTTSAWFSTNPARTWPRGEMVHVYRVGHANPDPAAHLASMKTADALSTPVEDRYRQVKTTQLAQSEQTQQEQQKRVRSQGAAGQGGLG